MGKAQQHRRHLLLIVPLLSPQNNHSLFAPVSCQKNRDADRIDNNFIFLEVLWGCPDCSDDLRSSPAQGWEGNQTLPVLGVTSLGNQTLPVRADTQPEPLTPAQDDVGQHHTATWAAWQLGRAGKLPENLKSLTKPCVPRARWSRTPCRLQGP